VRGCSFAITAAGSPWADVNRDHKLDVIAYGSEINIHLGQGAGLPDTPQVQIDCSPPALAAACSGPPAPSLRSRSPARRCPRRPGPRW
jgi:hypothetical protein